MGRSRRASNREKAERTLVESLAAVRQRQIFRVAVAYAVAAWLIIQVIATVGPAFDLPVWFLRAVVLAAIAGFVLTLAYFLLFRDPAKVGGLLGSRQRFWRLLAVAALLSALIAAGTYAARQSGLFFGRDKISLAVLPFADLSPKRDKAYFAEGVAEEILGTLAAEQDIRVLGRTSARQIERHPDPAAIRASLGVTHLLEGSTRAAGEQLRVNVRLIDTKTGSQLWEEEYQGKLADIFQVQDKIAATVVQRLRGTFFKDHVRSAETTRVDAYQLFLAARALMRDRSEAKLREAFDLGQRVIVADPTYAPGHAMLAEIYYLLSDSPYSVGSIPVAEARQKGIAHARRAIALAPSAEGYAALGLLHPNPTKAVPLLHRAIQLDPSRADYRIWLGRDLEILGRYDEAVEQYRTAVEIEPLWQMPLNRLNLSLVASGRQEEAKALVSQFRVRGGAAAQVYHFLGDAARANGDLSGTAAYLRNALARDPTLPNERLRMASVMHLLDLTGSAVPPQRLRGRVITARLHMSMDPLGAARAAGSRLWQRPDMEAGFFILSRSRDWVSLARLHDHRPAGQNVGCNVVPRVDQAVVLGLRNTGRTVDADRAFACLVKRHAMEKRQKFRWSEAWPGERELQEAGLAAMAGQREKALGALSAAISRQWLGQPFSSRLSDYPQFDSLRSDPKFALLQSRIDQAIAKERTETLAQR